MPRLRWTTRLSGEEVESRVRPIRDDTILGRIWPAIPDRAFGDYRVGNQQAHTTVDWEGTREEFQTTDQMHSEMVALDRLLASGHWRLTNGGVVGIDAGGRERPIGTDDFWTTEPHCGFCTVVMAVLGLPFRDGKATRGNFNYAEHLNYPLPDAVKHDPVILGRLLSGRFEPGDWEVALGRVAEEIAVLLPNQSDAWALQVDADMYVTPGGIMGNAGGRMVVTWPDTVRGKRLPADGIGHDVSVLDYLWKLGFRAIYEACR